MNLKWAPGICKIEVIKEIFDAFAESVERIVTSYEVG
jgi:hypothetical protein